MFYNFDILILYGYEYARSTINAPEIPIQPQPIQSTPVSNQKGFLAIILGVIVLLFIVGGGAYYLGTKNNQPSTVPNITNTQNNQQAASPTQSVLPSPTSIATKTSTSSFVSNELKISFSYPSEIGVASENPASQGKGGSRVKGEEWWRIDFDKTGFEPGYYELSASTTNYAPESWEGSPHWLNTKIVETDTEEMVKQKLITANYQVIKVQKVKNANNLTAFKVWNLDCYVGCILSRVYFLPLPGSKYSNLQLYTILKSLNAGDDNATIEAARSLATGEIAKIEGNQTDTATKKYLDGQNLIFNSLILLK